MKKYHVETERLFLHPLTYEQLKLYLQNDGSLEKELGIQWISRDIHPELKQALENTLLPSLAYNANYHFFTLWTMISKEHNCMIGNLCFKGAPCENGSVEIEYGIYPAFEKRGYVTEAVKVLYDWALRQKYVRSVKAETGKDNSTAKSAAKKWFCFYGRKKWYKAMAIKSSKQHICVSL